MNYVSTLFTVLLEVYFFVVLLYAATTFFLAPTHPVRNFLANLVEPLLAPIRRILPPMGGIDFSPMVLLLIVQIVQMIVTNLFR